MMDSTLVGQSRTLQGPKTLNPKPLTKSSLKLGGCLPRSTVASSARTACPERAACSGATAGSPDLECVVGFRV